jgi:ubiquinone/menaquinone biosynthesis C-methylase UbiE
VGGKGPAASLPTDDKRALQAYFARRAASYLDGNWQRRGIQGPERDAIEELPGNLDIAVDLGSGPGDALAILSEQAREVYAVDITPEMMTGNPAGHRRIVADAHDLPFGEGSVDLVFARMSVHYMDLRRLKVELYRVLSPAGYLLVVSAFPYSDTDAAWFNERHRIKRKPFAFTPTIPALVTLLSPEFTLVHERHWTQESSTSRTIRAHAGDEWASALIRHIQRAPDHVRELYKVRDADGDFRLTFLWGALTFRREPFDGERGTLADRGRERGA